MRARWLLATLLPLAACAEAEQRPQWLVHVGTDASVPAFGDRVRVDIIDSDGSVCAECQRTFDAAELPVSFGVEPAEGDPPRVRITLYRAAVIDVDGAPSEPLIELLASLPKLTDGETSVVAPLRMACFGARSDESTGESCDPAQGERKAALVLAEGGAADVPATGSFAGDATPCVGDEPGMTCVPGAVYLMGSATFVPLGLEFDPAPEQLVRVPSVWLDSDEVTVAAMRDLVQNHGVEAPQEQSDDAPYCTYGAGVDGMPVNCLSREVAEQACAALGKRLPTEAEWELAASGGTRDAQHPWEISETTNAALCAQAVLARGSFANAADRQGSRACIYIDSDLPEGPQPVAETRDEGHFGIRNLGGNVAEWVADDHSAFANDECWGDSTEMRESPVCRSSSSEGVTKGGDYLFFTYNSHSFYRRPIKKTAKLEFVGFRCAKDGQ